MIDVICRDTKRKSFEEWLDLYDDELNEIYSIEGMDLDGVDYAQWVEEFYYSEGVVF